MHAHPIPTALSLATLLAACGGTYHFESGPPVYSEWESNDTAALANDFGVLAPGDHFVIRGNVSDLACDPFDPYSFCDPFDGFAFTAAVPIHVEFSLLEDRHGNDFDVCLYDPQLDETVDCWQTSNHPEVGAVDVFAGGLSFHLVVDSFAGTGNYSLEIEVFGLYGSDPAGPGTTVAEAIPPAGLLAREEAPARDGATRDAFAAYGSPAEPAPEPVQVTVVTIDPETGATTEERSLLLPDGSLVPLE